MDEIQCNDSQEKFKSSVYGVSKAVLSLVKKIKTGLMKMMKMLLNEKNIALTRVLGRGPKMSKKETLYKQVKCKLQQRL